jgi:protein TonB
MLNRRLVTAGILSLGFHAVLLTAIGLGIAPDPGDSGPMSLPAKSDSIAVNLSSPIIESPNTPKSHQMLLPEVPLPAIEEPVIEAAVVLDEHTETAISNKSQTGDSGDPGDPTAAEVTVPTGAGLKPEPSGLKVVLEPSLITSLNPEYPLLARRMGVEGVVVLDVTVDRRGFPVDCLILPPRSHRFLEESALSAVMQARFQPGTEDGRPVSGTFRLKVRFELET